MMGSIVRPEGADVDLGMDLAGTSQSAQKIAEDDEKEANKEPDASSNTTPAKDPKSNLGRPHIMLYDSLKPGAIFYNPRLGLNEIKNKDGGSTITAKPALDTLPTFY